MGFASFIASLFAGLFVGTLLFSRLADRFGRRAIFSFSLLWYSAATLIMAFQSTATSINVWRFIAGIGIGVEFVTIDAYISELVPKHTSGPGLCVQRVPYVPGGPVRGFRVLAAGAAPPPRARWLAMGRDYRFSRSHLHLVHPQEHSRIASLARTTRPRGRSRPRHAGDRGACAPGNRQGFLASPRGTPGSLSESPLESPKKLHRPEGNWRDIFSKPLSPADDRAFDFSSCSRLLVFTASQPGLRRSCSPRESLLRNRWNIRFSWPLPVLSVPLLGRSFADKIERKWQIAGMADADRHLRPSVFGPNDRLRGGLIRRPDHPQQQLVLVRLSRVSIRTLPNANSRPGGRASSTRGAALAPFSAVL